MSEARTVQVTYLFLDIVGFTHNRSVEAQASVVDILNRIVATSVQEHTKPDNKVIYLPTGDGICIGLVYDYELPYDVYMQIAVSIISSVAAHNNSTEDNEQKFLVRIGVNSNKDNLLIDINGKENFAGTGINTASRIMNLADGNQIFVGPSVFNELQHRKMYMNSFRSYKAIVKHGVSLDVYQFISNECIGLNNDISKYFKTDPKKETPLTRKVAYYVTSVAS